MVSLWPWKGEDNSPASFEKALSSLATKITQSQAHLDSLRSNSRRFRALWTLYSSFAYLLCAIILFLVVGWPQWTVTEYTAVAGSPLVIYLVRSGITGYYNYRIDNATRRLEELQKERTKTIDKLKAATKYNSTQELLEKYGGVPPKPKKDKENKPPSKAPKGQKPLPGRVGAGPPPPTANINRSGQTPSQPINSQVQEQPQQQFPRIQFHNNNSPSQFNTPVPPQQPQRFTEEFAPNAFSSPPTYAQGPERNSGGGNWYDRVLDLLMGEDETSPKNRVALICQNCRLVNGQAPPGTKRLADLGRWRCFGCGGWNGEEDEAAKAVAEMKERIETDTGSTIKEVDGKSEEGGPEAKDDVEEVDVDEEPEDVESAEEVTEVKPSKRGRPKGGKKKA